MKFENLEILAPHAIARYKRWRATLVALDVFVFVVAVVAPILHRFERLAPMLPPARRGLGPELRGVFDVVTLLGVPGALLVLSVIESEVSGRVVMFPFAYYRPWRRVLAVLTWLAIVAGFIAVLVRNHDPRLF